MNVTETLTVDAPPEVVWRVGGDLGGVSSWIPALDSSHLDGDIRHVVFAEGGGSARERIVQVDDQQRFYVYEYLDGPLALERYVSRFSVQPHGAGASRITWTAELTAGSPEIEAELSIAIAGIYAAALRELARRISA